MRKDITIEKIMLGGEKMNKSELARQQVAVGELLIKD